MAIGASGNFIGLLPFFAFALSVIAAVLAIDMFRLLRTGEFGASWRVLIIASVIYAFMQSLRMAEFLNWKSINKYGFSQIAELMFALALTYSFYLQRKAFSDAARLRRGERAPSEDEDETMTPPHLEEHDAARETDWSRLGAMPDGDAEPDDTLIASEIERD